MRDYTNCDNTILGMVYFFSTIQIRTDETFQRFKSSARFDYAGEILTPDNRATSRVTYTVGDWSVFWRARFWDRSKDSNTPELFNENDCFCALGLAPSANEVPSYVYNDFSVSYNRDSYNIRFGINNAFDKQPPLLPQFTQFGNTGTNTVTEAYDTIGAAWYLQFNYSTN